MSVPQIQTEPDNSAFMQSAPPAVNIFPKYVKVEKTVFQSEFKMLRKNLFSQDFLKGGGALEGIQFSCLISFRGKTKRVISDLE